VQGPEFSCVAKNKTNEVINDLPIKKSIRIGKNQRSEKVVIFFSLFLKALKIFLNFFLLFSYSQVHTLFGSFLPLSPSPNLSPLPHSVPGRSCSAFITSFVEEKRQA
jgi:hypothetical protein